MRRTLAHIDKESQADISRYMSPWERPFFIQGANRPRCFAVVILLAMAAFFLLNGSASCSHLSPAVEDSIKHNSIVIILELPSHALPNLSCSLTTLIESDNCRNLWPTQDTSPSLLPLLGPDSVHVPSMYAGSSSLL